MKTLKLLFFSFLVGCSHNLTIKTLRVEKSRSPVFVNKNVAIILNNSLFPDETTETSLTETYHLKDLHRLFIEGYKKKLNEVANKVDFFEDKKPIPKDLYNFYFHPEVKIRMAHDYGTGATGCFVKYKLRILDGSKVFAVAEGEGREDFTTRGSSESIASRTCKNAMEDVFETVTDEAISKLK